MPKQCKVTPDMIDWAFEQRLDGHPFQHIADELGVHVMTIVNALEERDMKVIYPPLKCPFPIQAGPLTEDVVQWAYEKRMQGRSCKEVGDALYRDYSVIGQELKKRGLEVKHPPLVYPRERSVPCEKS